MNERYMKWYTPWLSREFEMLVFGNGGGLPLVLFPTSFGRYYQNKDFGWLVRSRGYIDDGKSPFIAPTRSIWKASTTNRFIRPTGCGRITPTKM